MSKPRTVKPSKWTLERCEEEAKKYATRGEFRKFASGCYDACRKNGWLKQVCVHLPHLSTEKWGRPSVCERQGTQP